MTTEAGAEHGRRGRWRRVAIRIALVPAFVMLAFLLGTIVPANPFWRQADQGVRIYVADNGVHTDLILPLVTEDMDWRPLLPTAHLRNQAYGDHVMVGFGDRDFYLNTPSWADLSFGTAARAMLGMGDTVMHVEHAMTPPADPDIHAITLSREEYASLVAFVRGQFRMDEAGRPVWISGSGYGPSDTFYESTGGYNLFRTCNNWTGKALRAAGIRMGYWTPLPSGVMFWLPSSEVQP